MLQHFIVTSASRLRPRLLRPKVSNLLHPPSAILALDQPQKQLQFWGLGFGEASQELLNGKRRVTHTLPAMKLTLKLDLGLWL